MIRLLKYFENDSRLNLVKLDDFSFVIHEQSIGQVNVHVFLSTNILVFILRGKKIVHADSGDIYIDTGEAFFVQKGTYLISEKLSQDNTFQSLIFFIDDSFLKEFTDKYIHSRSDIVHFMNENFTLPLSLREFAEHSSRSLTTFKKEFKNIYNLPPKQWINQQRLERARTLLSVTEKNVTEVCFDVGFDNVSHFIQLFKKRFGVTPKRLMTVTHK